MPAVVGAVRDVTDTEVAEPPTTMKKFIAYEIFGYVRLDAFGYFVLSVCVVSIVRHLLTVAS